VGGHTLLRSTTEGAKWSALALPLAAKATHKGKRRIAAKPGVAIRSIAFTSAQAGVLLDTQGRLWLTRNGGKRWTEVLSAGTSEAALLNEGTGTNGEALDRELFTTSTGGDIAGTAERLSLGTSRTTYTKRKLKAAHSSVRITGTLAGALGGEEIVVSRRNVAGGSWQHQVVVAGANGGSFATTWHITKSSVFVAQWAGDSGRPGQGSTLLKVTVR
jgi:hypothetical protein